MPDPRVGWGHGRVLDGGATGPLWVWRDAPGWVGGNTMGGGEEWEWTEQWGGRGINQVREGGHLARSGQHEGRVVVESGEQRGGQDQAGD